jgi:uncharacterized membrane protein YkvA (DUF1232 family)
MGPAWRYDIPANVVPRITGAWRSTVATRVRCRAGIRPWPRNGWGGSYHSGVDAVGPFLIVVAAILGVWLLLIAVIWLHRPTRDLAMPALRALPDIVRLARRLLADPRTPLRHRVGLVVLIVWLVSPIDLLPEFLPGIGPLDDIVAAAVILGWIGRQTGRARLEELWPGDAAGFTVVARMLRLPAE